MLLSFGSFSSPCDSDQPLGTPRTFATVTLQTCNAQPSPRLAGRHHGKSTKSRGHMSLALPKEWPQHQHSRILYTPLAGCGAQCAMSNVHLHKTWNLRPTYWMLSRWQRDDALTCSLGSEIFRGCGLHHLPVRLATVTSGRPADLLVGKTGENVETNQTVAELVCTKINDFSTPTFFQTYYFAVTFWMACCNRTKASQDLRSQSLFLVLPWSTMVDWECHWCHCVKLWILHWGMESSWTLSHPCKGNTWMQLGILLYVDAACGSDRWGARLSRLLRWIASWTILQNRLNDNHFLLENGP